MAAPAPAPAAEPFRIEVRGPELRSHAGLYGAGETRCHSLPGAGRLESCYAFPSLGVVLSGRVNYRGSTGAAEAAAGTLLLGNAEEAFSYSYPGTEDVRRAVVALDARLLAEVANDCGRKEAAFAVATVAAGRASAPLYAAIRRLAAANGPQEELAVEVTARALSLGRELRRRTAPTAERRRMREVAAFLDTAFAEPMTLAEMATLAGLSRFHFIRAFRETLGETPHQYLIGARLRAAADRLLDSAEPITAIALGVGFNDISHFNATFRTAFGVSPSAWRRPCARRAG
ncbi:MAG: helix-turn-helix transcriptional regulator [Caulobacterales bacterium]|nr:helix-turn-helix transcriptional regulator [Caulobacterales bacterium]